MAFTVARSPLVAFDSRRVRTYICTHSESVLVYTIGEGYLPPCAEFNGRTMSSFLENQPHQNAHRSASTNEMRRSLPIPYHWREALVPGVC